MQPFLKCLSLPLNAFKSCFINHLNKNIQMKRIINTCIILFASVSIWAQSDSVKTQKQKYQSTTLFNTNKGFGAYLGLNSRFSEVNKQATLLTGGEVSFVIAHRLNIGFEGYGMVNPVKSNNFKEDSTSTYLNMGYGGFHLEPVLWSDKLVHLSFPIMFGAGAVVESMYSYQDDYYFENDYKESDVIHTDFFLIVEPGANVELNVFKFMRLHAGVSYRLVEGADLKNLSNSNLQGLNANLGLRFGWF